MCLSPSCSLGSHISGPQTLVSLASKCREAWLQPGLQGVALPYQWIYQWTIRRDQNNALLLRPFIWRVGDQYRHSNSLMREMQASLTGLVPGHEGSSLSQRPSLLWLTAVSLTPHTPDTWHPFLEFLVTRDTSVTSNDDTQRTPHASLWLT